MTHVWDTCPTCKVQHAFPQELQATAKLRRGSNGVKIYCPNGHAWHYVEGETEEQKLRRELNNQRQQNARLEDEAREARAAAEKAERAAKRLKKRAAAGSCPCCKRSFSNMAEHMKHQHPDWVKEQRTAKVVPIRVA